MSNALAIAAVTAVLKDRLDNAIVDHSVNEVVAGAVTVTALAPDLIQTGTGRPAQINLYLYRVSPNAAWRNADLPSHSYNGERLTNPPLALDLHYLITAYASQDFQAEILLGYAMQLMHEMPVLTREVIRTTLAGPSSPVLGTMLPSGAGLAAIELAEQEEPIRLIPETMTPEEISKLWTAFSAPYRPSAAYKASLVLIRSRRPARTALPVLMRGPGDRGPTVLTGLTPPVPILTALHPSDLQPSAYLGSQLRLEGHHLGGTNVRVRLANPRLPNPLEVAPANPATDATESRIVVPLEIDPATDAGTWIAGLYALTVTLTQGGRQKQTNALPLALAPRIDSITANTASGTTTFSVQVTPEVLPEQPAALVVGEREAPAEPRTTRTDTLTFVLRDMGAGTYPVRLRVDGIESLLIDRTASPPAFISSQQVTV